MERLLSMGLGFIYKAMLGLYGVYIGILENKMETTI